MTTTAGALLVGRSERAIVGAFRAERALSGPNALRLKDLGLKETEIFRELISSDVIRRAGPERYFLDEGVWAARRQRPLWQSLLVVLVAVALGAGVFVFSRR